MQKDIIIFITTINSGVPMKRFTYISIFLLITLIVIIDIAVMPEINSRPQIIASDEKSSSDLNRDITMLSKNQPLENLTTECFDIVLSFYHTLGNFTGDDMPEVASIAYTDGRIHFYDIVNQRTYAINNDTSGPQASNGLAIAPGNFDEDAWDEVTTINKTGIITIIDGNGTTIERIDLNIAEEISVVSFFEVVDLDLDGYSDTVMLLTTEKSKRIFTIINGNTKAISVNLTLNDALDVTIGNFSASSGREIAIVYSTNDTVAIYNYKFQRIISGIISDISRIATVSNASWHYDALLALLSTNPKNVTIYNATTLTPLGYSAEVDFYWGLKPKATDLDNDKTTEIVIPTANGFSIFDLTTNNITKTSIIFSEYPNYLITSKITRDETYDFVIGSKEVIFMFKGSKGTVAKPRILRKISEPSYIQSFKVMQYDIGLPDLFVLTDSYLYVYRSDSSAPRLSDLKIYPLRPTIDDSYVSISAKIIDETSFGNPILIYNVTAIDGTLLEQGEVFMSSESYMSDTYLVYLSDLKAGTYTFKIIVTDSYDNRAVYDNNGSMYSFNVYSELLFRTKLQTVSFKKLSTPSITSDHPMDVGKLDDDQYDDVAIGVSDHAEIIWGNHSVTILDQWADVDNVEVYVADLLAGPSDDILVYYKNVTSSRYQIRIYNGSSLEMLRSYTFGEEILNFAFGDVNGDGYEDLAFSLDVTATSDKFIVMDTVNNVTLLEKETANIFDIGVFNLTGDQCMDVVAVSYDSSTKILNLTAYAGEHSLNVIYFFNRSLKSNLYEVGLFVDNFITTEYLQVALATGLSARDKIFLLNASNGYYFKEREIPYMTGLTPVDYSYDGIKEMSLLLYDNSLFIFSLLNDSFEFRKNSFLPEAPIETFYDNFDEDYYEDLIYVLSDEIAVYSIAEDRFETIEYPFRMIHSAAIGEFFELPSKDICLLTYDLIFEKYININMFYRPNITLIVDSDVIVQGGATEVIVGIRNVFGDPIAGSNVMGALEFNGKVLQSSSFTSHGNGLYTLTVSATNIPLGYYNLSVIINDDYYGVFIFSRNLTVTGEIDAILISPDRVPQGGFALLNVTLSDKYGYPISDATVNITFSGQTYTPDKILRGTYLFKIPTENLSVGSYSIVVTANHKLTQPMQTNSIINIVGTPHLVIKGDGITDPPVTQGTTVDISLNLYDKYNYSISGATVTAYFFGKPYTFTDLENGTYIATIPTDNVPGGQHPLLIEIHHEYLESKIFNANLTVLGKINLEVSIGEPQEEKSYIVQGTPIPVWIVAIDDYGYPIENATIIVSFQGKLNYTAENIRENVYLATLDLGKIHYGNYSIIVEASKPFHVKGYLSKSISIYPKMPSLNISFETFMTLLGISFAFSFLGLGIYYGVSSRLKKSIKTDSEGRIVMNFRVLDATYVILTLVLIGLLGLARNYCLKGSYELAVAVLSLALMELLLVFGVWLYRDIAITLISEKTSLKRFLFSFWHLILAPIIILLMFDWGTNIEWFAFYILKETMNLGVITVPSIYISLLGTYTTSIIIVALNSFLNSRQLSKRIKEMRSGGTPEKVLNEEKIEQLSKISNYIRIRFFGFLVVLGISIVSTVPLLKYYQVGILIVLPLFFIVLVPYLVSKILGILGFTKKSIEKQLVSH